MSTTLLVLILIVCIIILIVVILIGVTMVRLIDGIEQFTFNKYFSKSLPRGRRYSLEPGLSDVERTNYPYTPVDEQRVSPRTPRAEPGPEPNLYDPENLS